MGRLWKTAVAVAAIFVLGNLLRLCERPDRNALDPDSFQVRDSLTACINIRSGMYTGKGFLTGFQYTMLTSMADTMNVRMGFSGVYERRNCWQMLEEGQVDMVALSVSDSIPADHAGAVALTMPFRGYAWAVRSGDQGLLYRANRWLGRMVHSAEYADMEKRFFRSYSLEPYLEAGTRTDRISPYDETVKRHCGLLGWDWRLLSAVIFKESRFSIGAYSRRGATGLMQVMRSTAAVYGITDLFSPEENIKAGTMHLRHIERRYQNMGFDSVNVVKFTLAAYNAGESRIEDCINFTLDQLHSRPRPRLYGLGDGGGDHSADGRAGVCRRGGLSPSREVPRAGDRPVCQGCSVQIRGIPHSSGRVGATSPPWEWER